MLRHLRDCFHRLHHLLGTRRHLLHGRGDLLNLGRYDINRLLDRMKGFASRINHPKPVADFVCRRIHCLYRYERLLLNGSDQFGDLLRRLTRLLGQLSHLCRYDRKSSPMFACSCRFDSRVKRKQIGLRREPRNYAADLPDFLRTFAKPLTNFRFIPLLP